MTEETDKEGAAASEGPAKALSPAAKRALAEAEARRQAYQAKEAAMPKELGGRGGNEPGRYGDWEIKGLTSDF
jgi:hypothetical protein